MKTSKAYTRQVFLKCPFDAGYRPIYEAVIFVVIHCGFVLRCAREREDSGETRIAKIVEIIRNSQFGIHDTHPTRIRSRAASSSAFLNLTALPILKYGTRPAMRQQ